MIEKEIEIKNETMIEEKKEITVEKLLEGTNISTALLFSVLPKSLSSLRIGDNLVDFFVAIKEDGICYKLISLGSDAYLVGRDGIVRHLCSNFPLTTKKYVFDVEMVGYDLVVFDMMYMTDFNYGFCRRYSMVQLFCQKVPKLAEYSLRPQKYAAFGKIDKEKVVVAEGLIFVHNSDLYSSQRLYKWKNVGHCTVDFEVRMKNVYLRDYNCGPTTLSDGIYSVDVTNGKGNVRTDKLTSNSYDVASNVILTSKITYDGSNSIVDAFSFSINYNSVNVSEVLKQIHISFFRAFNTIKPAVPVPRVVEAPVEVPVEAKRVSEAVYSNVVNIYIPKTNITSIAEVKWDAPIFSPSFVDDCVTPGKKSDRYSVSGEIYDYNYLPVSEYDKKVTRKLDFSDTVRPRNSVVHFSHKKGNYDKKVDGSLSGSVGEDSKIRQARSPSSSSDHQFKQKEKHKIKKNNNVRKKAESVKVSSSPVASKGTVSIERKKDSLDKRNGLGAKKKEVKKQVNRRHGTGSKSKEPVPLLKNKKGK